MIRRLLGLGILLVAGIIGYNLYFGDTDERENAKEIVGEVKKIGKASWDLLKSEKDKMEDGKYDGAADKLKDIFNRLKGIAKDNKDNTQLTKIDDLEAKRLELERRLEEMNRPQDYSSSATASDAATTSNTDVKQDLLQLYEETERLMSEMEKNK